jgi:hypothetical protein
MWLQSRHLVVRSIVVVAGVVLLAFLARGAQAGPLGFTGTLSLLEFPFSWAIADLPIDVPGAGTATVAAGLHLSSLQIPAGVFVGATSQTPPSLVFPISEEQVSLSNMAGNFSGGTLGGAMPLHGFWKMCLFATCTNAVANLTVPLDVIGAGGMAFETGALNVTIAGAPWTTGTAAVGTLTLMGFAHGPASGTSSTAQASGAVRLVTPILISTSSGAVPVIPSFGELTLHFVPEPATLVLVGAGIGALALRRLRHLH